MIKNLAFRWLVSTVVIIPVWFLLYWDKFGSILATAVAAGLFSIGVGLVVQNLIIYVKGEDWPWPRPRR